jgi:hypothetical protein
MTYRYYTYRFIIGVENENSLPYNDVQTKLHRSPSPVPFKVEIMNARRSARPNVG